jgi:putative nucleotidyltransferase with HDIG domain
MASGITRDEALKLLKENLKSEALVRHSLATEAVLAALAERLGEDRDKWAVAGLLHDLDLEITGADMNVHGLEAARMLEERGVDPEVVDAVRRHNEHACGLPRETVFHHALAAGETLTGLIQATALVYPDRSLASVKPRSILKRMKEKAFAASVNRETVRECEQAGIPLAEFCEICLRAMQGIHEDLGL